MARVQSHLTPSGQDFLLGGDEDTRLRPAARRYLYRGMLDRAVAAVHDGMGGVHG